MCIQQTVRIDIPVRHKNYGNRDWATGTRIDHACMSASACAHSKHTEHSTKDGIAQFGENPCCHNPACGATSWGWAFETANNALHLGSFLSPLEQRLRRDRRCKYHVQHFVELFKGGYDCSYFEIGRLFHVMIEIQCCDNLARREFRRVVERTTDNQVRWNRLPRLRTPHCYVPQLRGAHKL